MSTPSKEVTSPPDTMNPAQRSQVMIERLNEQQRQRRARAEILGRVAVLLKGGSTKTNHQDKSWDALVRSKDLQILFFSMLGILGSIALASVRWYWRPSGGTKEVYESDINELPSVVAVMYICQACISITTLVSVVLIIQYYQMHIEIKRREWSGLNTFDLIASGYDAGLEDRFNKSYSLWKSKSKWKCLMEVIIHLVHPVLMTNPSPEVNDVYKFCQVAIFFRLYLLARIVYTFSSAYRMRFEVVDSKPELKKKSFRVTYSLVGKLLFYNYPATVTFFLALTSVTMSAFWMFTLERQAQPDSMGSLGLCFWFTWVTWATLGFGDIVPKTMAGSAVVVFIGFSNLATLTLFGAVVTNVISETREQKYVVRYLAEKEANEQLVNAAAKLIQVVWRRQHGRFDNMQKGNTVYDAIKTLRCSRGMIKKLQATVNDSVIAKKIEQLSLGTRILQEDVQEHANQIRRVTMSLRERTRSLIQAVKHHRNVIPLEQENGKAQF